MPQCTQPTQDKVNAEIVKILDGTSDKTIADIVYWIYLDLKYLS